ncbi:Hypothetical predicted protein [Mytilus galloprovincialis]|uniref:Reverse transcriptase RNase H-like domain-containing protein n=1 Tax=Mytilus galloprovincialis TaxID=29158 RepID=A0A8B6E425_MYTGA|nr:Hypothetical predicted protein [Mytilus galloprovincialis]
MDCVLLSLFGPKRRTFLGTPSHVLGTAEHFLTAVAPVLKDSSLPPEVKPFLLQVDKALGASQFLIMGSIANCTLSKRSEILDKAKVSDNLKDALIKSPLDEKIFGLPLDEVQKHLNQTSAPVKVNVSLSGNNSKRGSYSSAGGSSYNSQEKRRKITNDGGDKPKKSSIPRSKPNSLKRVIRGGLTLQFKEQPPLSPVPIPLSNTQDPQKFLLLSTEVETLLTKRAVEEVPVSSIDPGFYSRLFLVSKKTGGMRPVIDLSILNSYLIIPHFKMETNRSIRASILPGEHYLTHQCIVRPPQEKFQNLCSKIHLFLSKKNSYCSPVFTTARSLEFTSGCCSTWSPSHSTSSILSTSTLAPSYTGLGISSFNHSSSEIVSSFGLVDFSSKRFERPTSVLSSSKSDSVHRCLQPRSGSLWKVFQCQECGRNILKEHINILEMKAVLLALSHFQSLLQNKSLVLATDNTTVVAYLRNQEGTPPSLQSPPSSTD